LKGLALVIAKSFLDKQSVALLHLLLVLDLKVGDVDLVEVVVGNVVINSVLEIVDFVFDLLHVFLKKSYKSNWLPSGFGCRRYGSWLLSGGCSSTCGTIRASRPLSSSLTSQDSLQ
jgi:hypothetical protein